MSIALKQEHDELLATQPEGTSHDTEQCPFCNGTFETASQGGDMSYSEDELKTAIADAVAPLQARIAELETSQEQAALDAKVAEVTGTLTAQIEELQSKLDAAVLEAETAKQELASTIDYLQTVVTEEAAAAEFAQLKETRLAQVREVAAFPEDYLGANIDRWARLDEDSFQAQINDWKVVSTKPSEETRIPAETAMQMGTTTQGATQGMNLVREMMDQTIRGNDPRRV